MRYILMVVIFLMLNSCSSTRYIPVTNTTSFFNTLRKEKFLKQNKCIGFIAKYNKYRKNLYPLINFINYKKDTVFIMQSIHHESGTYSESIWNTKGKVEYRISMGKLNSNLKYGAFDREYYPLIDRWAIDSIQYYEKKYGYISHSAYITTIKVIIINGKLDTECIRFEEFDHPNEFRKFID